MITRQRHTSRFIGRFGRCVSFTLLLSTPVLHAQTADVYSRPVQVEPSRDFDAQHYRVTLNFDLEAKTFSGRNHVTLTPLRDGWDHCRLDAVELLLAHPPNGIDAPIADTEHEDSCVGSMYWLFFARLGEKRRLGDLHPDRPEHDVNGLLELLQFPQAVVLLELTVDSDFQAIICQRDILDVLWKRGTQDSIPDGLPKL